MDRQIKVVKNLHNQVMHGWNLHNTGGTNTSLVFESNEAKEIWDKEITPYLAVRTPGNLDYLSLRMVEKILNRAIEREELNGNALYARKLKTINEGIKETIQPMKKSFFSNVTGNYNYGDIDDFFDTNQFVNYPKNTETEIEKSRNITFSRTRKKVF